MKRVLLLLILLILSRLALANLSNANPYVKDLHKECAKFQQKCAFKCAKESMLTAQSITPEVIQCVSTCNDKFDMCEASVARHRELFEMLPLQHRLDSTRSTDGVINQEHLQSRIRQGRVVVEDPDL